MHALSYHINHLENVKYLIGIILEIRTAYLSFRFHQSEPSPIQRNTFENNKKFTKISS